MHWGDFSSLWGWLASVVLLALHLGYAKRAKYLQVAMMAVAWAEKYRQGTPEQDLEEEAVLFAQKVYPEVPSEIVRMLIRQVCKLRKSKAKIADATE
jgi:hypothetical protein